MLWPNTHWPLTYRAQALRRIAGLFAALFFAAGLAFVPLAGIQNDEALFASTLFPPHHAAFHFGGLPVMVLDYFGCLKTWLYAGIFAVAAPSPWSLRIPVILMGSASVALFTVLASRAGGLRAGVLGGAFLLTDPVFALTNNFDWGTTALQHLLLLTGLFAATAVHRTSRVLWIGIGAFAFGLGLWDKALFIWMLVPVCGTAFLLWPRHVMRQLTLRKLSIASAGFTLGAAPLLLFNIQNHWVTFRSHTVFSFADFSKKLAVLHLTANGSVLSPYLARGAGRQDLLELAVLAACAALPFLWRTGARKPALFSIATALGAWLQMACNEATGGAAHHVILLWPMPQLLAATVFARLGRAGLLLSFALVCSNVLVFERYWENLRHEGASTVWTTAMEPLSSDPALTTASVVPIADWGILDPLQLLHEGKLPLRAVADVVRAPSPSADQLRDLELYLRDPQALWISHTEGEEQFPDVNGRLERIAASYGLAKAPGQVYSDAQGRPIFETFHFVRPSVSLGARHAPGP